MEPMGPIDLADTPATWAKQRKPRNNEEQRFQLAVVDLAKLKHLRYFYVPDSRKCPAGWPDLFLWGPGGFLAIENKAHNGTTSAIQAKTHEQLRAAGIQVVIRRPHDLASGLIESDLKRLATPTPTGQRDADIALVMRTLIRDDGPDSPAITALRRLMAPIDPFIVETPKPAAHPRAGRRVVP